MCLQGVFLLKLVDAAVTAGSVNPAAIYDVYRIYKQSNNVVHIKYINHFFSNNLQTFLRSVRFPKSSVGSLSRRPFLSTWNMYLNQQRCVNKKYKPTLII